MNTTHHPKDIRRLPPWPYAVFLSALVAVLFFAGVNSAPACTIFKFVTKSGALVGRNFDWNRSGCRLVFRPAQNGSRGMVLVGQPDGVMPTEGLNDRGLFMGLAAVPDAETPFSPFKTMLTSPGLIEAVLARAADIRQAVAILPEYTVLFGGFLGNPQVHYLLADASGTSAVLEYADGRIKLIEDPGISQVMTNHFLTGDGAGATQGTSLARLAAVNRALILKPPQTPEDVLTILSLAVQKAERSEPEASNTVWSACYRLDDPSLTISLAPRWGRLHRFNLARELANGAHDLTLQ